MSRSRDFPMLFLLGLSIVVGVLYFRIVQPLILPLMLAGVMAVLFFPLYEWVRRACADRPRVSAVITTILILLVVLLPIGGGLAIAGMQLVDATKEVADEIDLPDDAEELLNGSNGQAPSWFREIRARFFPTEVVQLRQVATSSIAAAAALAYERTTSLVADVFSFVVGLAIFLLALYYFLAEYESILQTLERLSPLDVEDDQALWNNFVEVCRGVLLGTVAAALLQAVLNAVGFAVLGIENAFLLGFVTFFLALIPFVGAGAVWGCVTIGLIWTGEYASALSLALYGLLIVSTVDNLIRAHVLHDHGRLHPLVALVSIIGALQLVGFWGIIVGPVVAAFFYSLLEILHRRINESTAPWPSA